MFYFFFSTVTKLREHWDETNSKVMQRKTQLDAMLGDSQRYETKRNEVEVWLARMETRLERMRAVGHTADVLEAQLREQKVESFSNNFLVFFLIFSPLVLFFSIFLWNSFDIQEKPFPRHRILSQWNCASREIKIARVELFMKISSIFSFFSVS